MRNVEKLNVDRDVLIFIYRDTRVVGPPVVVPSDIF